MPQTAENSEKIRKAILDQSARLFLSQGYERTSIREIAQAAGMLKGNLYYYFKRKEDILLVLFRDSIQALYSELQKIVDVADPLVCYAVMTRTYIRILNDNKPLLKIYTEASQVPALRQAFFDILNQVFKDIIQNSRFSFGETELYLSTLASAAAEMELFTQLEHGQLNLDDILSTVVRIKLSLLGVESQTINETLSSSYRYQLDI